jgi:toxin-antitoxin system PIN domain toxin
VIAVDTNLLVYAHRSAVPEHRQAQEALQRAAEARSGWGIALPCAAEFWMVVTHPSAVGRPSTPQEARGFLERLRRDADMRFFVPGRNTGVRLLNTAESQGVTGSRIFDLQIGLIAVEAGATEIWTHDANFLAPPGLRVVDPLRDTVSG